MDKCKNCKRTTHRDEKEKKYLKTRLSTIEGQVRGVNKMIEEDKYCADVLTQLLAINKSIKCIANDILKSHLSTCVINDIKANNTETIKSIIPSCPTSLLPINLYTKTIKK